MPRGYPDFFGFSIFPFHGTSYRQYYPLAAVGPLVETAILMIAGKGILFSGYIRITGAAALTGQAIIYVDGATYSVQDPYNAIVSGPRSEVNDIQVLSQYDTGINWFTILMTKQITFGFNLTLTYNERDNLAPSIEAGLRYTLIQ